ncbi:MAG: hypothetical protein AAGD07_01555 [Planctomycetota bacterium]
MSDLAIGPTSSYSVSSSMRWLGGSMKSLTGLASVTPSVVELQQIHGVPTWDHPESG